MAVMPGVQKTLAGETRPVVHGGLRLVVSVRAQVPRLVQLGEAGLGDRLLQVLIVGVVPERIPVASQHQFAEVEEAGVDGLRQKVFRGAALCWE